MLLGAGVAKREIDFSLFERGGITVVFDAYDQSFRLRLCHRFHLSEQMFDFELLAPDPGGFVPMYFSHVDGAIR